MLLLMPALRQAESTLRACGLQFQELRLRKLYETEFELQLHCLKFFSRLQQLHKPFHHSLIQYLKFSYLYPDKNYIKFTITNPIITVLSMHLILKQYRIYIPFLQEQGTFLQEHQVKCQQTRHALS